MRNGLGRWIVDLLRFGISPRAFWHGNCGMIYTFRPSLHDAVDIVSQIPPLNPSSTLYTWICRYAYRYACIPDMSTVHVCLGKHSISLNVMNDL